MKSYARFIKLTCALALIACSAMTARAQERLPDGETTRWRGHDVWLIDPVTRYAHGVLGDAIEAGGFAWRGTDGRVAQLRLPDDAVFEDRRVRLADLDGDGAPEAVVIKAYLRRGAAIVVYGLRNGKIEQLAEGRAIGTANRWLNIAGIADVNGDGRMDIVYVQTPHLSGLVRVVTYSPGMLREQGSLAGYTNHVIDSRELDMAAIGDFAMSGRADIAVPSLDRRSLALLGFRNGRLREIARRPLPARAIGKVAARGNALIVELEGGAKASVTFAR